MRSKSKWDRNSRKCWRDRWSVLPELLFVIESYVLNWRQSQAHREAFSGCTNLREIEIPSSVEEFGRFVPLCNVKCTAGVLTCYTTHSLYIRENRSNIHRTGACLVIACCQACSDHCHAGHKVKGPGFCDCGAGECTTLRLFTNKHRNWVRIVDWDSHIQREIDPATWDTK